MYFIIIFLLIELSTSVNISVGSTDNSILSQTFSAAIADFGFVPYGQKIKGNYVYIEDICNSTNIINLTNSSTIVVTENENNCSYTAQAMKVQQAGSLMMILIDLVDEKTEDQEITTDHFNQITIPTIMISKEGGNYLKENQNNSNVILYVKFDLNKTSHVYLDYYMVSFDNESYVFLESFKPFVFNMLSSLTITPTFLEYSCQACKEKNYSVTNEYCISGGRYCALDPDGEGQLIGRDVVFEDLRQLCIYQNLGMIPWMNYAIAFSEKCFSSQNSSALLECSYAAMTQVKIDDTNISFCVNSSFVGPDQLINDSTILAEESHRSFQLNYMAQQALFINDMIYKGNLYQSGPNLTRENYGVLEAVCASFKEQYLPSICGGTDDIIGDPELQPIESDKTFIWISIVIGLIIFFSLMFYFVRRIVLKNQQNDLQEKVNDVIEKYYKMNSEKKV